MKYVKPLLGGVLGTCVLLAGCHTWDSTLNTFKNPLNVAVVQTQQNVLALVMAIHKGEIAVSKLAIAKAHHRSVKRFAEFTHHEHSVGLKKAMHFSRETGIQPVEGMAAKNVQNHGAQELASLKMLSGNAFDKAYIDDQVNDHADAVRILDEDIRMSTDPKLTALLKNARHHVMMHLEKAKMIQKELAR